MIYLLRTSCLYWSENTGFVYGYGWGYGSGGCGDGRGYGSGINHER